MHEIFTCGETPFRGWQNAYVVEQVKAGYRPPKPHLCPSAVYGDLITTCLAEDPGARPRFGVAHAYVGAFSPCLLLSLIVSYVGAFPLVLFFSP